MGLKVLGPYGSRPPPARIWAAAIAADLRFRYYAASCSGGHIGESFGPEPDVDRTRAHVDPANKHLDYASLLRGEQFVPEWIEPLQCLTHESPPFPVRYPLIPDYFGTLCVVSRNRLWTGRSSAVNVDTTEWCRHPLHDGRNVLRQGLTSDSHDMPMFRFTREDARGFIAYLRSIRSP